ncbi:MAG: hypothetical protein H0X41_07305 [Chitinophagaceae bacterium]|nr:hypothetical protein [Chitinophagaceae bacterium]
MKFLLLLLCSCFLLSCWKWNTKAGFRGPKVMGYKPVYAPFSDAKNIVYDQHKHQVRDGGNIYTYHQFIFQVDVGRGIHVINNANPAQADRVGFITVNGCAQISIQNSYLYTNSYSDLVVIDISDPVHLKEVSRTPNAFPDFTYDYPLSTPDESGYYDCPRFDSAVIGWVKDSVYASCYKQ